MNITRTIEQVVAMAWKRIVAIEFVFPVIGTTFNMLINAMKTVLSEHCKYSDVFWEKLLNNGNKN